MAISKSEQATGMNKFILDDRTVLQSAALAEFNSYRNWGYFPGAIDPVYESNADDNKQIKYQVPNFTNTKSLFNNVQGVGANAHYQMRGNALLIDSPAARRLQKTDDDCSVAALVRKSENGEMGRQIYRYADFMYCKNLGKMPNNYLITLRRFPYPCSDNISYLFLGQNEDEKKLQQHLPDIGRMVTWLGTSGNTIENILKYSVSMPFKKMDAKLEAEGDAGGDSGGLLGTLMNLGGNSSYQQGILNGTAGAATFDLMGSLTKGMMGEPPYFGKLTQRDMNKPWGPIDTIKSTHIRGEDGLQFNNEFTLNFDYELRSYDGVNGKAAFLDLISNILATTYSTGKFWGGGYRFTGASQHNMFANLPIYKLNNGASFSEISGAVVDSLSAVGRAMNGNKELTGNFLEDAKSIISNMGKQFAQAIFAGALNKLGRPMKMALNSLLSPAPVGFWHVTIGNPMHPIVQMGNMIVDKCEITQYGPLGLDDFPTGIKVAVTLKHGKMRDASLIEQMYQFGDNRIYLPAGADMKAVYESSDRTKQAKGNWEQQFAYIKARNDSQIEKQEFFTRSSDDMATIPQMNPKDVIATTATCTSGANIALALANKKIQQLSNADNIANIYMRHFGTDNMKNIIWAGQEGAEGSSPPKEKGTKNA